jgi:hypothetical protein
MCTAWHIYEADEAPPAYATLSVHIDGLRLERPARGACGMWRKSGAQDIVPLRDRWPGAEDEPNVAQHGPRLFMRNLARVA